MLNVDFTVQHCQHPGMWLHLNMWNIWVINPNAQKLLWLHNRQTDKGCNKEPSLQRKMAWSSLLHFEHQYGRYALFVFCSHAHTQKELPVTVVDTTHDSELFLMPHKRKRNGEIHCKYKWWSGCCKLKAYKLQNQLLVQTAMRKVTMSDFSDKPLILRTNLLLLKSYLWVYDAVILTFPPLLLLDFHKNKRHGF